jgi:hypothetical protein
MERLQDQQMMDLHSSFRHISGYGVTKRGKWMYYVKKKKRKVPWMFRPLEHIPPFNPQQDAHSTHLADSAAALLLIFHGVRITSRITPLEKSREKIL